jgi:23S rRNA A2030 N6-methylase RlmJ
MLLINPPWTLAGELERLLAQLAVRLAEPGEGRSRVAPLVGE